MSDSDRPRSTWSTLLAELQPKQKIELIRNESLFHELFLKVCIERRERDPQRLLAKFLRLHDRIIPFAGTIDSTIGLGESNCLNSLFWSIAFATFQISLSTKQKDSLFTGYFPRLNDALPVFGPQLAGHEEVCNIQKALQTIFKEYIECYCIILTQVASNSAVSNFEAFVDRVDLASKVFRESKAEWEKLVKEAVEEQAKRLSVTHPSVPNGTLGPLNPYVTVASFDWMETLGHGTYGQVSKVCETTTKTIFAQKVIRIPDPKYAIRVQEEVKNEVSIMQKLRHHHIASIQFYIRERDQFSLFMLPVADYDLLSFLQRKRTETNLSRTEIVHLTCWFGCLISALDFAHLQKVKHEDIKPRNILIKDYQPFLADFGCARDFSELPNSTSTDAQQFGTPIYWAPENPPRGRSADIFALGCVFSEMLTVRQGRTLEAYQNWRYVPNRDHGYAFRENLSGVHRWLRNLEGASDPVGNLLVEQTMKMLEKERHCRPDAHSIKKGLRMEGDAAFCPSCF